MKPGSDRGSELRCFLTMFCVGEEMQVNSVCQGDSGSVYVVWDDRALRWVATGIVSWGVGCGKGYGFYTKVLSYVDWIKGVIECKDRCPEA